MRYILVVSDLFYGGSERLAISFANTLANCDQHNTVNLFLLRSRLHQKHLLDKKVRLLHANNQRILSCLPALLFHFAFHKYDFCISFMRESSLAMSICPIISVKNLLVREGNPIDVSKYSSNFFFKFLVGSIYRRASRIVANSYDTANSLKAYSPALSNKISVLPNPIQQPSKSIIKSISRHRFPVFSVNDHTVFRFVSVGRLHAQKNYLHLLDIIKALSSILSSNISFTIDIWGEGPLEAELKHYVIMQSLEDIVFFRGVSLSQSSLYSNYDFFISTPLYEGFGNVYIEALSWCLPVITTLCPGRSFEFSQKSEDFHASSSDSPIGFAEFIVSTLRSYSGQAKCDVYDRNKNWLNTFNPLSVVNSYLSL